MSFTTDYNSGVRSIAKDTLSLGLDLMVSQGVRDTTKLFKSARFTVKYSDNEAELIQLMMHRYGFVQMSQGGLNSKREKDSPAVKGRRMSGGDARTFLSEAAERKVPDLADYVAKMFADKGVDAAKIGVKIRG
jgi:hypothetical protein